MKIEVKKIWKTLHSMKLGIILLLLIGLLSIIGTVIPQGYPLKYYEANYSHIIYEIIATFSLDKVYSSWWFIVLISFLSVNLTLCSIIRFKKIITLAIKKPDVESELKNKKKWKKFNISESQISNLFTKMRFNKPLKFEAKEGSLYYQDKNRIGYLGSWLTHLGLLMIIVFFAYGKINGFEAYVHGIPGEISQVEGTDFFIAIDDFDIKFRDDYSVEQYISQISILKGNEILDSGKVLVNHPFRTNDLNIYQNGTGWAVKAKLYKDGKEYKEKTLYQGDFFIEDNQKIALQFVNFYPDLDVNADELRTKTPLPNHPVMLYALFYDGYRVDMNLVHMGETVEYKEYKFDIDEPQMFTILQIVRDPGTIGAAIGGVFLVVGIFLAMFVNPQKIRVYIDENGRGKIYAQSHKNNPLFQEELQDALRGEEEEDGFY